jgi:hypothetical protein
MPVDSNIFADYLKFMMKLDRTERAKFYNHFVGALSVRCNTQGWNSALRTACYLCGLKAPESANTKEEPKP